MLMRHRDRIFQDGLLTQFGRGFVVIRTPLYPGEWLREKHNLAAFLELAGIDPEAALGIFHGVFRIQKRSGMAERWDTFRLIAQCLNA